MPALKDADEVSQFLSRGNRFVFDSVRDSGTSDLCRKGPNGELECVKVPLASMALFALMGKRGMFCANITGDPAHTEIECRRIAEQPLDKL